MFQRDGIQVDDGDGGEDDDGGGDGDGGVDGDDDYDYDKTCGDVPECIQDWQVELADKVKRLALALFHLAIVINNTIISRKQWSVTLFTSSMNIATSSLISPSIPAFPKPKSLIAV